MRPSIADKPDDPRHGTQNGYGNLGCRCARCKAAHAADKRQRYQNDPHARRVYLRANRISYVRAYDRLRASRIPSP